MQKKKHRFWQHRFGRRHFGRRSCCCIDHHCYHHFYCGFFSNQTQQEAEPNWLGYENTAKHHLQRWLTNSYVSNRINSIDSNCNDPGLVFVFSVNQNAPKNKKKKQGWVSYERPNFRESRWRKFWRRFQRKMEPNSCRHEAIERPRRSKRIQKRMRSSIKSSPCPRGTVPWYVDLFHWI